METKLLKFVINMSKKSAVLTISIWDNQVRLSLIGKNMLVIDHVSFKFSMTNDKSLFPY
mgnify:CR=1 FL=1